MQSHNNNEITGLGREYRQTVSFACQQNRYAQATSQQTCNCDDCLLYIDVYVERKPSKLTHQTWFHGIPKLW